MNHHALWRVHNFKIAHGSNLFVEITLQVDKDETASIMLLDVPAAIEEGQPKNRPVQWFLAPFAIWSDMVKLYLSSRKSY